MICQDKNEAGDPEQEGYMHFCVRIICGSSGRLSLYLDILSFFYKNWFLVTIFKNWFLKIIGWGVWKLVSKN
jgi:hypothetical protein